ncbi:MAG: hypothetical protein ACR2HS_04205, partial [Gammaproteobacteria bacterium]
VVIVGHGVKQTIITRVDQAEKVNQEEKVNQAEKEIIKSPIIETYKLSIISCNLEFNVGFKVKEDALLYATGTISYVPENFKVSGWLALQFPKVKDFMFAKAIPGSLYTKVLADNTPIVLSRDTLVRNNIVVVASDSMLGAAEISSEPNEAVKLHTGEEGKMFIQVKGFNLTKERLYGGKAVTLLATEAIECGTIKEVDPQLEPYVFTNGSLIMATNKSEDIVLRHANITALEEGLFQGKEIKHIGVNLSVGINNGGLTYIGQPVVEHRSERILGGRGIEALQTKEVYRDRKKFRYIAPYRRYRSSEIIISRRNKVKTAGKLVIEAPQAFIGSGHINLEHGVYTGASHVLGGTLTATVYNYYELHEVRILNDIIQNSNDLYRSLIMSYGVTPDKLSNYEYEYDTITPSFGAHGAVNMTINAPLAINYNFVGEEVNLDLGEHKLTVGSRLTAIPRFSELTLIKAVEPLSINNSYIQKILSFNNIITRQPIFPIEFARPQLKIIVLNNMSDYRISDPNEYSLDHPFLEMQDLIETIKQQLGHKQIGDTGLNDKEIYYYMLVNALEHAKSGKPFLADTILKPMLVYKENPDHSMKLISLLPKILDIPELRANVWGIFCRLLTAKGTASSAIELLGAIISKEGGSINVGKLTILQQYRETWKVLISRTKTRNWFRSKTRV